jgi:hypothetical protein
LVLKKALLLQIFLLTLLTCCEENNDYGTGKVLFCTNSMLINCPFSINIYLNNDYCETLTAASTYYHRGCSCDDSFPIGLTIEKEIGPYNYFVIETNCQGSNRKNSWTGEVEIKKDKCTVIFLDIFLR